MTETNPLIRYQVIDRLEVGPVVLEPRRLRAAYRLTRSGQTHATELIYRFEEPVFSPSSPQDQNLAAMLAVQLALNYGLFCKEIVFHGTFDEGDRQFIMAMMENTAREIVVKKLHEHNKFLLPGWQLPQIPILEVYSQAKLNFTQDPEKKSGIEDPWPGREEGYCVLSSGGKESLLSYGLLAELGCDTHPIYINESGRHWFTALNGYRHHKINIPQTSRVWTNCDRLFNWVLRHISFIRPDFQTLRADDYPLRLWTVAVFLFGSLPLLKKRGLGHLVVGNEFDTSRLLQDGPLAHYDGIFDQSIWFDHVLTDYFMQKGWAVRVLSIVRSLSETLVEKILATRYPQLFASQVSCHAALIGPSGVRPCGRCEKCRRIISILTAMEIDPGRIGYTDGMIKQALKTLSEQGLHSQLASEFSQVQQLLGDKNAAPEIMHLRFCDRQSPASEIPGAIRMALIAILEKYCAGILEKKGDQWQKANIL